jgi:hypothetical protein
MGKSRNDDIVYREAEERLGALLERIITRRPAIDDVQPRWVRIESRPVFFRTGEQLTKVPVKGARYKLEPGDNREPIVPDGEGFGHLPGWIEGLRQLKALVPTVSPVEWAGPLIDAETVCRHCAISPETLDEWCHDHRIIALSDTTGPLFPVGQFFHGRPVTGLAEIVAAAGSPSEAWQWLTQPGTDGEAPLSALWRGAAETVIERAQGTFGL